MYITLALEELSKPDGIFQDTELKGLPNGLFGYYGEHWERMGMDESDRPQIKVDILQFYRNEMRAASAAEIFKYLQQKKSNVRLNEVSLVIDEWEQFLRDEMKGGQLKHRFYHASYFDFLETKLPDEKEFYSGIIGDTLYGDSG